MNSFFSPSDTIFDITEQYPAVIPIMLQYGLDKMANQTTRQTIGRTMQLQTLCQIRHIDLEKMTVDMNQAILANKSHPNCDQSISIRGVLPCPIRIPLMEKIEGFITEQALCVDHVLPAASTGVDWIFDEISGESSLSDIYLSAGFSLFFDREKFGKYTSSNLFIQGDFTYHPRFQFLEDPHHIFTIMGMVPAIFMVNKTLLGDRAIPTSWSDLLEPDFKDSIAVPMKDLDLFNAILLCIYKEFGLDGVRKLGENCLKNMHPAQMVKNSSVNKTPCISISPYFFAAMLPVHSPMVPIWPKDGAIVSPIFLLAKKTRYKEMKPMVDFLLSKEIGDILSSNGKFPSTSIHVENNLSADKEFMFCGWDFIHSQDIGTLLTTLETTFYEGGVTL